MERIRDTLSRLETSIGELQEELQSELNHSTATLEEMRRLSSSNATLWPEGPDRDRLLSEPVNGSQRRQDETASQRRIETHIAGRHFATLRSSAAQGPEGALLVPRFRSYGNWSDGRPASSDVPPFEANRHLLEAERRSRTPLALNERTREFFIAQLVEAHAYYSVEGNRFTQTAFDAVADDPDALRALVFDAVVQWRNFARQTLLERRKVSVYENCEVAGIENKGDAAGMLVHQLGPLVNELFELSLQVEGLRSDFETRRRNPSQSAFTLEQIETRLNAIREGFMIVRLGTGQAADDAGQIAEFPLLNQGERICAELLEDLGTLR